ncbi:MAG TPA: tetratricopeptide repeat protein [Thermoanaerobaculia bacterium]|nr:tetratricopeptide repeat protein [Thermoanaerobaculia bacterium]
MSRATTGGVSSAEQGVFFVHIARARQHVQEERYDIARKELELAQLARPHDEDVLNLLSVIEFKRGYYHEAAQASRALLKDNPNSPVLHSNLGLILFKAGVLGEAEAELQRAIELQPDHARSHLYLGLLHRMRGKLGPALEHLRLAGAKRAVAEIEEALANPPRRPTGSLPAPERPTHPPSPPDDRENAMSMASILKLAEPLPAPPPAATSAVPGSTPFVDDSGRVPPLPSPHATDRVRTLREGAPREEVTPPGEEAPVAPDAPDAPDSTSAAGGDAAEPHPLFQVREDGGLEVASRGVVFVRKGSVVWYSGKIRFSPESAFRGTRLEKLLRAEGRGHLLVSDPGRRAFHRDLNRQSLFLEGSRVLALDHGLSFRLELIHDFRMNRRVDVLKIFGRGSVVLSVGNQLLSHDVSPELPLNVSSRDLVAWMGELVPSVVEDRFLEEVMMPDIGKAPKIRFEGRGTVWTEPPRPRRRASDLSRPSEDDRRS